ncbi:MAG TPA: dihydropteroate synthase [Terriglobia bacterium]|nr:dihydropteroate synthase [Terriglobia bacterium]
MKARPQYEITLCGRKVRLGARTLLMGVLNVTPDSFSDGGLYFDRGRAVEHALEMARQGADWIDVGGESTRPGAKPVSEEEELRRVLPVIAQLHKRLPKLPISIDTTKAVVAEQSIRAGASLINDVSGLRFDERIAEVARRYRTPLVLMHLRGHPATMQQKPFARSILRSLTIGLTWSIRRALSLGARRSQLIIDPGLGFGKTRRQNYEILAHLTHLQRFRLPILVGASRKSFVQAIVAGEGLKATRTAGGSYWKLTAKSHRGLRATNQPQAPDRQNTDFLAQLQYGDAAAVAAAILGGAHIVRVHDVAAIRPAARIADAILAALANDIDD